MKLKQKLAQMLHTAADSLAVDMFRKSNVPVGPNDSLDEQTQIDFRADRFATGVMTTSNYYVGNASSDRDKQEPAKVKISVSPRSVVDELRRPPTNISLSGLDTKLDILKKKRELITQRYSAEHIAFMITAMEARKKFDKKSRAAKCTYREYFTKYATTDEVKIEGLLSKYDLVMKGADLFVPEFPDEAIEAMDLCSRITKELSGKLPRFYVIASPKDFEKVLAKRDPILLVQSPFGMYYYILGAWDKEMVYLPEL